MGRTVTITRLLIDFIELTSDFTAKSALKHPILTLKQHITCFWLYQYMQFIMFFVFV